MTENTTNPVAEVYERPMDESPYKRYAHLRDQHPVYYDSDRNVWLLSRYDDVRKAFLNSQQLLNSGTAQDMVPILQAADGELHRKVRTSVIRSFSSQAAKALKPAMESIICDLFDSLPDAAEIDLLSTVIKPIPQRFMSGFLGFPEHLQEDWFHTSQRIVQFDPRDTQQQPDQLFQHVIELVDEAIEWKREHRGDDFFTWLIEQQEEGVLTRDEMNLFSRNLGFGSLDTTINMLSSGTALLAAHPEQRDKLCNDRSLLGNAMAEMLRYESPTQAIARSVSEDIQLHGTTLPRGAEVSLLIGSANRDPRHYDKPDEFNIERKAADHLAFGVGVHFCPGKHIALLEAEIFFTELLKRWPNYRVVKSSWLPSAWARAHAELIVSVS